MPREARCELCGAPLSFRESAASRYACLATCLPLVKSKHLSSLHSGYLAESRRAGRPLLYTALMTASLAAILAAAGQTLYIVLPLAASSVVLMGLGTYIRLRLISRYRRLEGRALTRA